VRLRHGQAQQLMEAFAVSSQSTVGRSNAAGFASGLMWDEETDHDIRVLAAGHLAENLAPGQLIELLSVTAYGTSSMKMATFGLHRPVPFQAEWRRLEFGTGAIDRNSGRGERPIKVVV
jgi:hypothetical protein